MRHGHTGHGHNGHGFDELRRNRTSIMGLFGRKTRPVRAGRKPTRAERRAAERTAQAEANLERTEEQIHQLADEVRRDLRH
jgi:hypothetical protein